MVFSQERPWWPLPTLGAMILVHSGPAPQTISLAIALWLIWASDGHGPLLTPPSN